MSGQKAKRNPIAAYIIGASLVLVVLVILIGGKLLTGRPTPTPEPLPPSPSATSSPTIIPTATPLPSDALILQPIQGVSNLYIEYILDASGSMLGSMTDGTSKRDAARDYLIEHLLTFSPETHVGLRAYGHREPWENNKEASCQDIELIAPVDVGQMETMAGWLDSFECLGMTPLYASIEMALDDFDTDDPHRLNNIILISDGIETCGEDPCALAESVAKSAKEKGIEFAIHVVGLDVDDDTRTQLSCIADKGGGVYYDVHDNDDLQDALDSIQDNVQANEQIVTFAEATQSAMPPTSIPTPRPTRTPTQTPRPTSAPTRTPTPQVIQSPTPIPPTPTPEMTGCTKPNIASFKAVPPPQGSTARFSLEWTIQGANRAEIFGNPVDPTSGRFDVWDDQTNYWVLWAKKADTPDDCYVESAIQVDPDTISPPGPGFGDVTVSQRDITISVRDHASIDGDRIDLFVNGAKVLSNYTLTSSPYGVAVTLNSGENTVMVTALNEGSSSPNTVAVSVNHVVSGNPVQVSSGLSTGQSESFKIHAP